MMILIDCDPGIDDTAALLALAGRHHRGEAKLVGVSTVGGNVPVAQSTSVAALALALAHLEDSVPLYQGYDSPSLPPQPGFHGADGIGNCYFEHARAMPPQYSHYHDVVDLIATQRDELVVLCVGPLTNAALWVEELEARRLPGPSRWVVMGGAFEGHPGNTRPGVEFNIWADVDAAARFFAGADAVDVIPLNVTEDVLFTADDIAVLGEICPWFGVVLSASLRSHSRIAGAAEGVWLHDLVAVAAALGENAFNFADGTVAISTAADTSGTTTLVPEGNRHRVAQHVDPALRDRLVEELRTSLTTCIALDHAPTARAVL